MWSISFPGMRLSATLLGLLFVPLVRTAAQADEPKLSISGYDPVAYFTEGKALFGRPEFELNLDGAVWRFSNEGNRGLSPNTPKCMRRALAAMTQLP